VRTRVCVAPICTGACVHVFVCLLDKYVHMFIVSGELGVAHTHTYVAHDSYAPLYSPPTCGRPVCAHRDTDSTSGPIFGAYQFRCTAFTHIHRAMCVFISIARASRKSATQRHATNVFCENIIVACI
jgi:hypothetical protein